MAKGKTYTTRPIAALTGVAAMWLAINAVADAANIALGAADLWLMRNLAASNMLDEFGTVIEPTGLIVFTAMGRMPIVALSLITSFIVLKWIYRANRNAHAFVPALTSNPPWAVGWFFVPIALLWKPFQYMSEVWRVSHHRTEWRMREVPGVMRLWWGAWIVAIVIGNTSMRLAFKADTVGEIQLATVAEIVVAAFSIVAGLSLRRIVQDIGRAQTTRMATEAFE